MVVKTNSLMFNLCSLIPASWNIIRLSYVRVGDDYINYAVIKLGGYK